MMFIYDSLDEVPDLPQLWAASAQRRRFLDGEFADYERIARLPGIRPRIIVDRSGDGPPLVAPFYLRTGTKTFTIGERRLFGVSARTLFLYTQWMLEHAGADRIIAAFAKLHERTDFDWVVVGETPVDSNLATALQKPGWRWLVSRPNRKDSLRWLIDLPATFDSFLLEISSSTRQSLKRKMRKLEKSYRVEFERITKAEDILRYLKEGERISRSTYQWKVGQQLHDDKDTAAELLAQARRGEQLGYLLSLDGKVCAFLRGSLQGTIYNYETPGFDPQYRKDSVGTISLLYALRDLMENTDCHIFDFGQGGDDSGYKSTFGNRSIPCVEIELGRIRSITSHVIADTQNVITLGKKVGNWLLRNEALRARVKRALRGSSSNT